jgi:hypothetical protein
MGGDARCPRAIPPPLIVWTSHAELDCAAKGSGTVLLNNVHEEIMLRISINAVAAFLGLISCVA